MDALNLRATDTVAMVAADGSCLTYRELMRLVASFCRAIPSTARCLVGLLGDRELGVLTAHLAALRDGHAVAWFGAGGGTDRQLALIQAYQPEILVGPEAAVRAAIDTGSYRMAPVPELTDVTVARRILPDAPEVHPDTRLLLFTSGSLGGGKAVRLSAGSIAANASGICQALQMTEHDRGATSLPLYYSYGLSILHSHLLVGGSLLLTSAPATGPAFWRSFAAARCRTFSGVPVHFEWLDRSPVPWRDTDSLARMTVAGGRIRTGLARRFHEGCEAAGRRFYKMYGQTEATARISVLAHEDFAAHPESVGRVLPGGRVTIEPTGQADDDRPAGGRIIYHGSSTMQGYAQNRADLALPDQNRGVLDTRDLGYLKDGFLYLTGRAGRFVKPAGRRVELDELESIFAEFAAAAAVGSAQERAHVFLEAQQTPAIESARRQLLVRLGLPPAAVVLHYGAAIARRPNGKVDYGRLEVIADEAAPLP